MEFPTTSSSEPAPSLIPVRRLSRTSTSLSSPIVSPISPKKHRRRVSALSFTSEDSHTGHVSSHRRNRTSSSVSSTHSRLATSIAEASPEASPAAASTNDRPSTPSHHGDDDNEPVTPAESVDHVRAAPQSSTIKRRSRLPSLSMSNVRRNAQAAETPLAQRAPDERHGLSRIPRASVTHAVSLHGTTPRSTSLGLGAPTSPSATFGARSHEDGLQGVTDLGLARSQLLGVSTTSNTSQASTPSTTMSPFPKLVRRDLSPRRSSGKTGGIIDALQTELDETKAHLDRVKTEVRNCHREISMLTRTSEDLRETRDRMRSEGEALNNVISRKERMMNELLTRARTAESVVAQHTEERNEFEARAKKAEEDAAAEVAEATAARAKAESERDALRDSVRSLRDVWARDVRAYRAEVSRVQEEMRTERENAEKKQAAVLELVKAHAERHSDVVTLVEEVNAKHKKAAELFEDEVRGLRAEVERNAKDATEARQLARTLATELARLRRLTNQPPRPDLDAILSAPVEPARTSEATSSGAQKHAAFEPTVFECTKAGSEYSVRDTFEPEHAPAEAEHVPVVEAGPPNGAAADPASNEHANPQTTTSERASPGVSQTARLENTPNGSAGLESANGVAEETTPTYTNEDWDGGCASPTKINVDPITSMNANTSANATTQAITAAATS